MPRKKVIIEHVGVFEETAGSGKWSVRLRDRDGNRFTRIIGSHKDAVDVYEASNAALVLGTPPPIEILHGAKFKEIANDAINFYREKRKGIKSFKSCVNLAIFQFGIRLASTIKPLEMENWIDDLAEEREWSAATRNHYKS